MGKTWLITGCSAGFGLSLTRYILAQGHNVIATSRNPSKTPDLVKEITSKPSGRWLSLDVTSPKEKIETVIQEAEKEFGGIDVLVNNAGYSVLGAAEDIPEDKAKAQFEVNFWGAIRTTQAILPQMRSRKSGTIVNISSIAGLDAQPTCAIYAASKFALEAWSESLSREVGSLGLRVLIVEPGAFRTNFLTKDAAPKIPPSEAYQTGVVQTIMDRFDTMNGAQIGDPDKAAKTIFEVVLGTGVGEGKTDLLRLPLGPDCYARATDSNKRRRENLEAMQEIALSTNLH
ncbi:putative short chain oxidoreductase/dehydrogenase [Exophiala viscosa]|uniref:Short chain oxidoreductase/dehydrogenase n=1 Tax=Exophiala viscosa TaxID=2486360 RepID=A0AAN6I9D2_9EURO|nr:putative short chain oxidoreductase/dehydrogenase [Exophiala viscosa]